MADDTPGWLEADRAELPHVLSELDHSETERDLLYRSGAPSAQLARDWVDGDPASWSVEALEVTADQINALRVLASNAEAKADQLEAAAAIAQRDLGCHADVDAEPARRTLRRWAGSSASWPTIWSANGNRGADRAGK